MNRKEIIYVSGLRCLFEIQFQRDISAKSEKLTILVKYLGKLASANGQLYFFCSDNHKSQGEFSLTANHKNKCLTFGPFGNLGMLPEAYQGYGIGQYCMIQLINEFSPRYAHYSINSGKLSSVDAQNDKSRYNRNYFYENLGFNLKLDETKTVGKFSCDNINELNKYWNRSKIREVSTYFFTKLLSNVIDGNRQLAGANKACLSYRQKLKFLSIKHKNNKRFMYFTLFFLISIGCCFIFFFAFNKTIIN